MKYKGENIYKRSAQRVKADKLADVIQGAGGTSAEALRMSTQEWGMVTTLAGVHAPSSETKHLAISILEDREETRRRVGCTPDSYPAAA